MGNLVGAGNVAHIMTTRSLREFTRFMWWM